MQNLLRGVNAVGIPANMLLVFRLKTTFCCCFAESKVRMENLLGVMMRLRNARNLDSRQTNAVDSAYFACRPPDKATQRRRRPPLQVRSGRFVVTVDFAFKAMIVTLFGGHIVCMQAT
jgi:hypothetical protein